MNQKNLPKYITNEILNALIVIAATLGSHFLQALGRSKTGTMFFGQSLCGFNETLGTDGINIAERSPGIGRKAPPENGTNIARLNIL